jgi:hypothetical protein
MSPSLESTLLWLVSYVNNLHHFVSICQSEIALEQSAEPGSQIIQVSVFPYLFFFIVSQAECQPYKVNVLPTASILLYIYIYYICMYTYICNTIYIYIYVVIFYICLKWMGLK